MVRLGCLRSDPSHQHSHLRLGRLSFLDHSQATLDRLILSPDAGSLTPSTEVSANRVHLSSLDTTMAGLTDERAVTFGRESRYSSMFLPSACVGLGTII
jgi:uncharacterized FAD-dependent dehydrogenase